MILPYSDKLPIGKLCRLFDNTSECYKFFWFKSILSKVIDGKLELTFDEIINDMILNAWYMVTEYHLNLGPHDTLESIVNRLSLLSGIPPFEKKENILNYIINCKDKEILRQKRVLTENVPYRLHNPFLENFKGDDWKCSNKLLAQKINKQNNLLYNFIQISGLNSIILVKSEWAEYLLQNYEIINGWLEYNMILYLQRRNPNVPGISAKLMPPQVRKLNEIKKLWSMIIKIQPVHEIYSNSIVTEKNMSIDHFVPWSYVSHDEIWNLNPTTKNINSSKSNNLPNWDNYFPKLCQQEYSSYLLIWEKDIIHKQFNKCIQEHLHNLDILYKVYRKGLSQNEFSGLLESIIKPVYQSAQLCGFKSWNYQENSHVINH